VVAPLKTAIEMSLDGDSEKARARLRGLRDGLVEGVRLVGDGMTLREQWTVLMEYPEQLSKRDERK